MTAAFPENVRATARRLRREESLSVRQIAARLGIGRSTAGNYVQGVEAESVCAYCGGLFWSENAWRRYCCESHRRAARYERESADPSWRVRRSKARRRQWANQAPERRAERNARRRAQRRASAA